MKLEQIDQNFKVVSASDADLVWVSVREEPFSVLGVRYDETHGCFVRMPWAVAESVSDGVRHLNCHTSGGRVRFRTDSDVIAIRAVMPPFRVMPHMPVSGAAGFDLYRTLDGKETYFKTFMPPADLENGYTAETKTFCAAADYTINFPLYHGVNELYVGIRAGARLEAPTPYRHAKPVVFYGSSITQGGCASRPGNSYQGFLSRRLSTDFINLGFSGSGKGERAMAEYIATLDMSVLVMDYDSNAPTVAHLAATHEPFFKIVREKNPNLPILAVSHPSALHRVSFQMGNYEMWGARRDVIRATVENARAAGDDNAYFLDGSEIYKGDDWDAVTVDVDHPNDFGFYRFACCLEPYLKRFLEPSV